MEFFRKIIGNAAGKPSRKGGETDSSSTYRCVQINGNGASTCEAVLRLRGKRFLPGEIPSLPLPECTAESCNCSYELFSDRRRVPRNGAEAKRLDIRLQRDASGIFSTGSE